MTGLLRGWILFCTGLVALGWLFSIFSGLVPETYEIAIALFIFGWLFIHRRTTPAFIACRRIIRRLTSVRLLLPGIFAICAALLFVKGIAMPPFHDDGLCYRIPRAMNWIMAHRWHWINAQDPRLDILGTVSEWLSVPILLIFHTDRLVFLPNWICYPFMPGLIFSVWRMLGVPAKIAWISMWLLPTGFCFALQAANTSNDSLGAFFILTAFFFALKGNRSKSWSDFAFSILCMALATGVKINLISLGLAWAVAMGIGWRTLLARPVPAFGILSLGALVSFAPTALLNWSHERGWTGLDYVQPVPAGVNFICTTFHLLVQNLIPPLVGGPDAAPVPIPGIQGTALGALMERYFLHLPVIYSQIPVEQAGIGFIVVISFVLIFLTTQVRPASAEDDPDAFLSQRFFIFACLGLAFAHYMLFVSSDQPARLISAYYLVLLPVLFVGRFPRTHIPWRFYKIGVGMAMVLGLYLTLFFTENPLCNYFLRFEKRLYWDNLYIAEVRRVIPESEKSAGIIRFYNQRETWLWKPYGSRNVIELPIRPDPVETEALDIHYIAISKEILTTNHLTIDTWLEGQPWVLAGAVIIGDDNTWYFVKAKR